MATNKPDSRQTHVTRIFGTNRAGELLSDVWVDVERMDVVKSALQVPPDLQWQAVQRKFRWCDDPAADDYSPDGTPSRNIEILKVCDPDSEDVDNPGEWVPVKVIKAIRQRVETGTQDQGGTAMDRFLASVTAEELTTERVVEVRRTVHRDTNIDNAADAAADAGQKEYVVPSEAYEKDADSKDDGQYIEQEIITYLKHRGNANEVMGQGRQTKLLNEYLIEQSEPPKNEVVGAKGFNPPYRLDPYQTIVNVNFGSLAAEFYDESFIELSETLPPTRKMVASIWFRAPAGSLARAKAEYQAWKTSGGPRAPLTGIVPIAVFGASRSARKKEQALRTVGTVPEITSYVWNGFICGWDVLGTPIPAQSEDAAYQHLVDGTDSIDPSYIGIDCSGDVPKLAINIVMPVDNTATFEGSVGEIVSTEYSTGAIGLYGGTFATDECTPPVGNHTIGDGSICDLESHYGPLPFNDFTVTDTYESSAIVVLGYRPETFRTLPADRVGDVSFSELMTEAARAGGQEVTAEAWHQLLLSTDLSNPCRTAGVLGDGSEIPVAPPDTEGARTTGACKMWIAFDDVNLTGKAMSCYWPTGHADRNAILPVNGYYVAGEGAISGSTTRDDCFGNNVTNVAIRQQPKFSYSPAAFAPGKVSFPAPAPFVTMDKHIELGECQIFTDVTVDTALMSVRRAFVTDSGTPAPLKKARDLLGKDPEVLVHGSANWKSATNTGSLAGPDGSDGTVVGRIEKFRPNPKLGK
jgi:hypothetical protein